MSSIQFTKWIDKEDDSFLMTIRNSCPSCAAEYGLICTDSRVYPTHLKIKIRCTRCGYLEATTLRKPK